MRIGWDQYETALLIEACEQVTQSKVSRVIAAQELSKSLRDRAQNNGIEIDELFRNENGMILQMAKMDYLLLNGEKGLPGAGKLFETMAQLRKANPEQYYEILRTAKMQIDGSKEENRKLPDNDMRILIKNSDTLLDYFTDIAGQFPELIFTNYDATSVQQRRAVYIYKKDCSRRGNVLFEIWMLSEASTFAYFIKREYLTAEENAEVERTDSRASATRGRINRKWNYVDEFLDFIKEKLALTRESGPSNEKADPMYKELQKTVEYLSQRYEVLLHYDRFTNPAHTVNDMMYKVKINEKDAMWVYYIHRNRNHYISIETEPEYLRNMVGGTTGFTEIHLRTSHPCQKMMFVNYDDIKESLEDICDSIDLSFNAPASRETEVKYSGHGIVTEHMFLNYCESVGMAPRSSGNYASSIRAAENYAMEKNIIPWRIYNVEREEALKVIETLLENEEFHKINERRHHVLTNALKKYTEMVNGTISTSFSKSFHSNPKIDESQKRMGTIIDVGKAEAYLLKLGLNGATVQEIIDAIQPGAAVLPMRNALDTNANVIGMPNGRYVHAKAFVDLDEAEEDLRSILKTHFVQFGGYSNSKLLFGAASHDLSMFLNDNDCEDIDSVYSLAQYFFSKKRHEEPYVFSFPHIFERSPEFPLTLKGLMINLARANGGVLHIDDAKNYLQKTMLTYGGISQLLQLSSSDTFLYYDESHFLLAEKVSIDSTFQQTLHDKLDGLFRQADVAFVIPRDIAESWLHTLPALPQGLPWTVLLLQEVLRNYPDIGFRPITSELGQAATTIAAAIVPLNSALQSFPDIVTLHMQGKYALPKRMACEELRQELREAGMLEGNELIYALPKALDDFRFSWTDENKTVLVRGN